MLNTKPSLSLDEQRSVVQSREQRRNSSSRNTSGSTIVKGGVDFASFLNTPQDAMHPRTTGADSVQAQPFSPASAMGSFSNMLSPTNSALRAGSVTQVAAQAMEQAKRQGLTPDRNLSPVTNVQESRNAAATAMGLGKGEVKAALLQRNAPSLRQGGAFDGKEAMGNNAPPSAGALNMGLPGSPVSVSNNAFSLQQARKDAQAAVQPNAVQAFTARQELSGTRGAVKRTNKSLERISGRPITGRNNIGMVDPRKSENNTTVPIRRSSVPKSAKGTQANLGLNGLGGGLQSFASMSLSEPGLYFGPAALDIFSHNAARPQTKADNKGIASNSMSFGSVRNISRPDKEDGVGMRVRTEGHRQRENEKADTPISAHSNRALLETIQGMRGEIPVGVLAAKFESGQDGIAAIGYDRHGGTSYGKFQFSSKAGTLQGFIGYLEEKAPDMAKMLKEAGPANTGRRSGKMPEAWKTLAAHEPLRFEQLQNEYIKKSHFEPALQGIEENTGISVKNMPPALQEVVFSTAVQHGVSGATRIISRALDRIGLGKLEGTATEESTFEKVGRDFIKQIYALRSGQFISSTPRVRTAVKSRLQAEMSDALKMIA